MSDTNDIKIGVSSNSTPARNDLKRLADSIDRLSASSKKTEQASSKIGKAGAESLKAMEKPIDQTASGLNKLIGLATAFAAAIAAGKSVSAYYTINDELRGISNRLKLVTKSQYELLGIQKQMVDVSMATNAALKDTAVLYYNVNRAAAKMGQSQSEIVDLTKTIQLAAKIGEISAEGTAGAMIQLAQGLASGVLRGEEFNSIMENTPRIAQAMSDSFKVTIGELRRMSEAGELASEKVLRALKDQASTISKEYASTTRTVADGVRNINTQVKLFVGEIDAIDGASSRLANGLLKLADGFGGFVRTMRTDLFVSEIAMKNQIKELKSFSSVALTTKKVLETFSFGQIFNIYQGYENSKRAIENMDKFLQKIGMVKKEQTDFEKLKDKINFSVFGDPAAAAMAAKKSATEKAKAEVRSLKQTIKDSFEFTMALGYAIGGLFDKISWLVPTVFGPVQTAASSMYRFIQEQNTIVFAYVQEKATRLGRIFGTIFDFSTYKIGSDTTIERIVSRLFRSESIGEMTERLNDLGDQLRSIRGGDVAIFQEDANYGQFVAVEYLRNVAIWLNLIDNRFIAISKLRFDRLINYFQVIGSVIRQVYEDNFRFPVRVFVAGVRNTVMSIVDAVYDAIKDSLTTNNAELLAGSLVGGISKAISAVNLYIKGSKFSFENLFGVDPSKAFQKITELLKLMYEFVLHFLSSIGKEIEERLPRSIRKMVDKVKEEADRLKNGALKSVLDFGRAVKDSFFNVYEDVVGHSTWPDLIDGVISESSRLSKARDFINRFTASVRREFANLRDELKDAISGTKLGDMVLKLNYAGIGDSVYRAVSMAMTAAVLFMMGTWGKLMAVSGLLNIFESSFLYPVLDSMKRLIGVYLPDEIAKALGTGLGIFVKSAVTTTVQYFDMLVRSIPAFMSSLLDELPLMLGSLIQWVLKIATFGSEGLIYTLMFGYIGYAGITGKLKGVFAAVSDMAMGALQLLALTPKAMGTGRRDYRADQRDNRKKKKGKDEKDLGVRIFGATASPLPLMMGIAALASVFLDSVSILESAVAGMSLLSYAFFGKEGGARLIVTTRMAIFNIGKEMVRTLGLVFTTTKLGAMIAEALSGGKNDYVEFGKSLAGYLFGTLKSGATSTASGIKKVFANIEANKKAFSSGGMSVSELFFGRGGDKNHVAFWESIKSGIDKLKSDTIPVKEAWTNMMDAVALPNSFVTKTRTMLGRAKWEVTKWIVTLADGITKVTAFIFADTWNLLKIAVLQMRLAGLHLRVLVGNMLTSIAMVNARLIASGGAFGRMIGSFGVGKFALLATAAIAMGLFATNARAASVNVANIEIPLSGTLDVLKKIGIVFASLVSLVTVILGTLFLIDWKMMGLATAVSHLKINLNAIKTILSYMYLGFVMVSQAAIILAKTIFRVGILPLFTKMFWVNFGVAGMLAIHKMIFAIRVLAGSVMLFGWGLWKTLTLSLLGVAKLSTAFWWLITTMYFGFRNIKNIALAMWAAILTPIGAVVAVVTAVSGGLLATWLFGKGDTFIEKLEYVYEMVAAIFTGDKARVSKERAVVDKVSDATVEGKRYEFLKKIESINYSQMAASEYDAMLKIAEHTQELINEYRAAVNGGQAIDANLIHNIEESYRQFNAVAARAPKLNLGEGIQGAFQELEKTLLSTSLSLSEKIGNFISYTLDDIVEMMPDWARDTTEVIGDVFDSIGIPLQSWWNTAADFSSAALDKIKAAYDWAFSSKPDPKKPEEPAGPGFFDPLFIPFEWGREVGVRIVDYWNKNANRQFDIPSFADIDTFKDLAFQISTLDSFISDADKTTIQELVKVYNKSQTDLEQYKDVKLPTLDNSPRLQKLTSVRDRSREEMISEVNRILAQANFDQSIALFGEGQKRLSDMISSTGTKVSPEELLFGDDVNAVFAGIAIQMQGNLEMLRKSFNSDIKIPILIDNIGLRRKAKEVVDDVNSTVLFTDALEFRMKIGGVEASSKDMQLFFLENRQQFDAWSTIIDSINEKQRDLRAMPANGAEEAKAQLIREIKQLERVADNFSPDSLMSKLNKSAAAAGADSFTGSTFGAVTERTLEVSQSIDQMMEDLKTMESSKALMPLDKYTEGVARISAALRAAGRELNTFSKSAVQQAAEALSAAGATEDKIRALSPSRRSTVDSMVPALNAWKGLAQDPSTPRELQRVAQLAFDRENKRFARMKIFEDPKDSLFDRFSELVSRSTVDVNIEQLAAMSEATRNDIIRDMKVVADDIERISYSPGLFPANSVFYRQTMENVANINDKIKSGLLSGTQSVNEMMSAIAEGTGIKSEDLFTLEDNTLIQLSQLDMKLKSIANEKARLKSIGPLGGIAIEAWRALDRDERAARRRKTALLSNGVPDGAKLSDALSNLGVSIDDAEAARLTADQIQRLISLSAQLSSAESAYAASNQGAQDWIDRAKVVNAVKLSAVSVAKTDIDSRLAAIGVTGIETVALLSNVESRSKLLAMMAQVNEEYQEYLALSTRATSGEASSEELERLEKLRKSRKALSILSDNAKSLSPITNLKELSEALKIDIRDLSGMSGSTLLDLRDNRHELTKLFNELDNLGVTEQDRITEVNKKIAERLKIETDVTNQIEQRKQLTDSFKQTFSDSIINAVSGKQSGFRSGLADTITSTVLRGVSDQLFSGLSKSFAAILTPSGGVGGGILESAGKMFGTDGPFSMIGDLFKDGGALSAIGNLFKGDGVFGELGSATNPMWVQVKNGAGLGMGLGSSATDYGLDLSGTGSDLNGYNEWGLEASTMSTEVSATVDTMGTSIVNIFDGIGTTFSKMLGMMFSGGGGSFNWGATAIQAGMMIVGGMNSGPGGAAGGTGFKPPPGFQFDSGGIVPGSIGSPKMALVHSGETILPTHKKKIKMGDTIVNLTITGDISRQTRAQIYEMIPQISAGVNAHNKETNFRR